MRIIRDNARNLILTVRAEQATEISAAGLFPFPLVLLAVGDTHTAPHISPASRAELHLAGLSSPRFGEEREHLVTSGPPAGRVTTELSSGPQSPQPAGLDWSGGVKSKQWSRSQWSDQVQVLLIRGGGGGGNEVPGNENLLS